jgi:hypothetical protein
VKKLLPFGMLVMLVAAKAAAGSIDTGRPLVSGDTSIFSRDRATEQRTLSSEQLHAMALWLEEHRSGWHGEPIEASPNEVVELKVTLRHADDGGTTSISVIAGSRGGHLLRLTGPGTWAYRSFAGIYKTWAAIRPVSDEELRALQRIIGIVQ